MKAWHKNLLLIVELTIVTLFIIFVTLQGGKRFTLDEMDFPTVSKATSQTLRPVWYKGEATSQQSGLFHPPLYINSLATFIRIFGFSEMTVRLFGLLCALITSYLLIKILRLFKFKNRWGEALLLGLFLLNPYTVACATVPDIDTTIMPIAIMLFIYLSLGYYWKQSITKKHEQLVLGSVFALNLWTKLTTPLMLPGFLFILLIICGSSVKSSVIKTIKITLIGSLIFLSTYFLYTKAVSLPISYTFKFLAQSFFKGTTGNQALTEKIINNAHNIKTLVYWFTIPLTFVYVLSLIGITLNKKMDRDTNVIRLLAYFGLAILVFYLCLIAPFGGFFKYPFPIFGLMILTFVFYFQNSLVNIKINLWSALIILALSFLFETHYYRDNVFKNHAIFNGLVYLFLLALLSYALLNYKKTANIIRMASVYFLLVVIGFQIGITRVQAISTYPTKYLYGQQGMNDAINYLKLNTKSNEIIWSMKDIGFYVNDKYYENYPFFFDKRLEPELVNLLVKGDIRYYVVTTGIGEDRIDYYKDIAGILEVNATKVASYGNFVIYRSNNAK